MKTKAGFEFHASSPLVGLFLSVLLLGLSSFSFAQDTEPKSTRCSSSTTWPEPRTG